MLLGGGTGDGSMKNTGEMKHRGRFSVLTKTHSIISFDKPQKGAVGVKVRRKQAYEIPPSSLRSATSL